MQAQWLSLKSIRDVPIANVFSSKSQTLPPPSFRPCTHSLCRITNNPMIPSNTLFAHGCSLNRMVM